MKLNARNRYVHAALLYGMVIVVTLMASPVLARGTGMTAREAFSDPRVANLLEALKHNHFSEATKALAAGADVNTIGTDGISPLLWIIGETLNLKQAEFLLKAGANPNYRDARTHASAMFFAAGGSRTTQVSRQPQFDRSEESTAPRSSHRTRP